MSFLDKLDRHADLMTRMADTVGADLADAAMRGQIRPDEIRSAVLRCTACDQTDACAHWMADHSEGAAATPGYCRNKGVLDRLAKIEVGAMLMFVPGLNDQSYWQTQGMARSIGVDLTEALANGSLDRKRFAGMVAGCGACRHGADCTDWLGDAGEAEAAPEFCRLKSILETLKVRQS